jgi:hypothetical protein
MSASEALQVPLIRKKSTQVLQGKPFYAELVEEILKEDNSKEGPELRDKVLKSLEVADDKAKPVKAPVVFKNILLEGIMVTGSTASAFSDIAVKISTNKAILDNQKQGFLHSLIKILRLVFKIQPPPTIYELDYIDPVKGVPVREKINFHTFRADLERRAKTLSAVSSRGPGMNKLEAMQEDQLTTFLERNVRDIQAFYKTLGALDDFFKAEVERSEREKIKGIKPELATIKNAIIRANAKRHEYSAQKEEEEQLKRLGISGSQG